MDKKVRIDTTPNYHQIFNDIIDAKYPEKRSECEYILKKKNLSSKDILKLNNLIFGSGDYESKKANQRTRSYKKEDIISILKFQKNNFLNNTQTANHFSTSRNSIAKWKKIFPM